MHSVVAFWIGLSALCLAAVESRDAETHWCLKSHGPPQYLDRVPTDAHVGDLFTVPRRTDEDFARPFHFHTLLAIPYFAIQLAAHPAADPVAGSSPA